MHCIKQSSLDYWEFKLFCIGILWLALGYALLSTFHVLPPPKQTFTYAPVMIPVFFLLVSYVFVGAIIRVVWPVTFLTVIVDYRILFRDSRKVDEKTVVSKPEVTNFYIEKKQFWHGPSFRGRVICVFNDGSQKALSPTIVPYESRREFLDSVANLWGKRYVQQEASVSDVA